MSQEKNLNNIELQKSTSRRSRKDEEGRDYLCGCGKRYLSYPALYTHIKTKHDGRQPEGTQKTGTNIVTKRIKGKIEDETHKNFSQFLQRNDVRLLTELEDNFLGCVSISSRIKRQAVPKDIFEYYLFLLKQSEIVLNRTSCLDMVLTIYLWNMGEYVNEKLFDHYILFSKILRNCYSEYSEQIYKACFSTKTGFQEYSSINIQQIQYVPIICDCLLRYYIPYSQNIKQFKEINLSLMELMVTDFCGWLFRKKLTSIQVRLKKEYRLESKPVPIVKHRSTSKGEVKDRSNKESSQENKKEQENSSDLVSENDMLVPSEHAEGSDSPAEEDQDKSAKDQKHEDAVLEQAEPQKLKQVDQREAKMDLQEPIISVQPPREDEQVKEAVQPEVAAHQAEKIEEQVQKD